MQLIDQSKKLIMMMVGFIFGAYLIGSFSLAEASFPAQIPTGSIPTVTGTPAGAIAIVLDNEQGYINVRGGPSTVAYDIVGVLVEGSQVPALGRSPGGDWVQISYPGVPGSVAWVYSDLLVINGSLPVVEPPPTATPLVTATIDPTLAAQFLVDVPPTRLPTFTAPPPLVQPTFPADAPIASQGRFPMGLVVIGMVILGILGTLLSFVRGR